MLVLTETRPALTTTTGQFQDPTYFTQTPRVEYSDEGSLAITSYQDRVIADVLKGSQGGCNDGGEFEIAQRVGAGLVVENQFII